jgi:hypothetical protein
MSSWKTCDICGIPDSIKNRVKRFGLRRMEIKKVDGKWTSRAHASGSLDICRECWEKYAQPRMQPQKGRKRVAT